MYHITFNYLAIFVAAIATFVIGFAWYTVLFGKLWLQAHGYTPDELARMRADAPRAYGLSFVAYVVMAFAVSALIQLVGIVRWQGGAKLGVLCWLGFAATIGFTAHLYSNKKLQAFLLDAGYQLVYLAVMGAILAGWR